MVDNLSSDGYDRSILQVEVAPTNFAEGLEMRQLGDRKDGSINSAQLLLKAQPFANIWG